MYSHFCEALFKMIQRAFVPRTFAVIFAFNVAGVPLNQLSAQPQDAAGNQTEKSGYTLAHVLPHTTGYVNDVLCSGDGSLLLVAGDDGRVTVWNAASGDLVRTIGSGHGPVYAVAITADGATIAAAGYDGNIRLWSWPSGRQIRVLAGHEGWVNALAFAGNGRTLVSGGRDRAVRVWDVETGKMLHVIRYPSEVFAVAADAAGRLFASDKENSFTIREISTAREIAQGVPGQWGIDTVLFTPNRPQLISSGYDSILWAWNIKDAKLDRRVNVEGGPIISLATTADGTLVAALCTGNGTVALFDTSSWMEIARLKAVTYPVGSVTLSADGRVLAAGGGDSPVRIWYRSNVR